MTTPFHQYEEAVRFYGQQRWSRAALSSKRMRMLIRLLALEERCIELNIGAVPPKMLDQIRLLSDYKEAHRKAYYEKRHDERHRFNKMISVIAYGELLTECGHPVYPRESNPVIADLREGDRLFDDGQAREGVFCSKLCADGRRVRVVLEEEAASA